MRVDQYFLDVQPRTEEHPEGLLVDIGEDCAEIEGDHRGQAEDKLHDYTESHSMYS